MKIESYFSYEEIDNWIEQYENKNRTIASVERIGYSDEGRAIKAVHVTNNSVPIYDKEIVLIIIGRHGDTFDNFGDYSVNLFKHIDYYGDPPARSLFDMAAVAVVKNPAWAKATEIPCPTMINKLWVEQPDNPRKIIVWEYFDAENILADFYASLKN